jgi:DNA polymerase-3 subunit epsilon
MISLHIQSLPKSKKVQVPYRITSLDHETGEYKIFNFRPECTLPRRACDLFKIDRLELLHAPPFCDTAEELIDFFYEKRLYFFDSEQYVILKSLFKNIGFNFEIKPFYYFNGGRKSSTLKEDFISTLSRKRNRYSPKFSIQLLEILSSQEKLSQEYEQQPVHELNDGIKGNIASIKNEPGVYFFLDKKGNVSYVGKAKYLRKRLQSHFSNKVKNSSIDYSLVTEITVEYTGNDLIAQLVESENIKKLKPIYNTQQINDAAPYIINIGKTAKGIAKASIVRKSYVDNLPEEYFNRESVKIALTVFCDTYKLCRKHCGIERVKGPCSRATVAKEKCVCSKEIEIATYNETFSQALNEFKNRDDSTIYKLRGRTTEEDAFIYVLNGIYNGYGYIDKGDIISNKNDVLGNLNRRENNYDTTRIIANLREIDQISF